MNLTYTSTRFLVSVLFIFSFVHGQAQEPFLTFELPFGASPTLIGGGLLPLPTEASPLEIKISVSETTTGFGGADGSIDGDVIVRIVDASREETEVSLDPASRITTESGKHTIRLVFENNSDIDGELIRIIIPENAMKGVSTGLGNYETRTAEIGFASSTTKITATNAGMITRKTRFLPYTWNEFGYTYIKNNSLPLARVGGSLDAQRNEGGKELFYYSDEFPLSSQRRVIIFSNNFVGWDFSNQEPDVSSSNSPYLTPPSSDGVYDLYLDVTVTDEGTFYSDPIPLTVSTEYTASVNINPINDNENKIISNSFSFDFDYISNTAGTYEVFVTPPDEGAPDVLIGLGSIRNKDVAIPVSYEELNLPAGPDGTVQHGDYTISVVFTTAGDENLVFERATTTVTYTEQLSVNDFATATTLYPNPTTNSLILSYVSPTNTTYSIFDMAGKHLATITKTGREHRLDVSHLPNGVYVLKTMTAHQLSHFRFAKK